MSTFWLWLYSTDAFWWCYNPDFSFAENVIVNAGVWVAIPFDAIMAVMIVRGIYHYCKCKAIHRYCKRYSKA